MIKIRYVSLPEGTHAWVASQGRRTIVYLRSGLGPDQRRDALLRVRRHGRAGYGPRLPAAGLARAVAADRAGWTARMAAAAARGHPLGMLGLAGLLCGAAACYLVLASPAPLAALPPAGSPPPAAAGPGQAGGAAVRAAGRLPLPVSWPGRWQGAATGRPARPGGQARPGAAAGQRPGPAPQPRRAREHRHRAGARPHPGAGHGGGHGRPQPPGHASLT